MNNKSLNTFIDNNHIGIIFQILMKNP